MAAQLAAAAVHGLPSSRNGATAVALALATPVDRRSLVDLAGLWGNILTSIIVADDGAGDGAGGTGTVLPRTRPDTPTPAVIILLHGFASSAAARLDDVADSLSPAVRDHVTIFAPSTRRRDAGGHRRSWFAFTRGPGGVHEADPDVDSAADLAAARERVDGLVAAAVMSGVPRWRIVVAGYSQGGGVAMEYGLRSPPGLGGILSYSGFLPTPGSYGTTGGITRGGRLLLAHARDDRVSLQATADVAAAAFRDAGWVVTRPTLMGGHAIFATSGGVVSAWLTDVLRLEGNEGAVTPTTVAQLSPTSPSSPQPMPMPMPPPPPPQPVATLRPAVPSPPPPIVAVAAETTLPAAPSCGFFSFCWWEWGRFL